MDPRGNALEKWLIGDLATQVKVVRDDFDLHFSFLY